MKSVQCFLLLAVALHAQYVGANVFRFPNGRQVGNVDQVTVHMKVGGDILEMHEGKVNRVKMGGAADLEYMEKTLAVAEAPHRRARSIRDYRRVEATIRVGDDALQPAFRPERSLLVASVDDHRALLFSPQEPLSRDELATLDILGNSLLLDRFLPHSPLEVGQTWKPDKSLLAHFLEVDTVGQTNVQCELVEVTDTVARFQITGDLEATIHGIPSRVQLMGKYRYDRRTERIDWFALAMKEVRATAPVAEGFDVVAQVQVRIVPQSGPDAFDREIPDGLTLEPRDELVRLRYESADSSWRLTHNPKWFDVHETPDLVVFRLVEQGEVVAQCRISPLPQVPVDRLPTLERFREDVRQALGDRFERFVSAGQWAHKAQYRVYRVAVSGAAEAELEQTTAKVPIEWRYYLVADREGRRMAFAFSVEAELTDRLGDADRELVGAFRFVDGSAAGR